MVRALSRPRATVDWQYRRLNGHLLQMNKEKEIFWELWLKEPTLESLIDGEIHKANTVNW